VTVRGASVAPSNTIRKHTEALRAFCKFLRMSRLTKDDPMLLLSQRKLPRRIPRMHKPEEIIRLIEAGRNPLERAIAQFLYSTAVRVSELVKIRIEDVDFDTRIARIIKGKGVKSRIVPFGEYAAAAIREYHAWQPLRAGWLFEFHGYGPNFSARHARNGTTSWYAHFYLDGKEYWRRVWKGRNPSTIDDARRAFDRQYGKHAGYHPRPAGPLNQRTIRLMLARMANRAGIRGITPHALRRACATHLLESGASIRVVQEILGHARLTTTTLYTLLSATKLSEIYVRFHPHAGDNHATSEAEHASD
jgi:integrase/recombinase XerC